MTTVEIIADITGDSIEDITKMVTEATSGPRVSDEELIEEIIRSLSESGSILIGMIIALESFGVSPEIKEPLVRALIILHPLLKKYSDEL